MIKSSLVASMVLALPTVAVTAFGANTGRSAAKSEIGCFQIDGLCEKKDISNGTTETTEMYNEFEIQRDTKAIKSKMEKCLTKELKAWTAFALEEARSRGSLDKSESEWWEHAIEKIVSLEPAQCGVMTNPGSENKLAILQFKMKAERKKGVTGNGLLSLIHLNPQGSPIKVLLQFISNKSVYDITRDVGVKYVCDMDKDGLAEVILLDQRYAGYNFWITRFGDGFSRATKEFVDGMRGD